MATKSDSRPLAPGELAPAQAVELAGQVDYVAGSVVSRTLAKKPTGHAVHATERFKMLLVMIRS